MIENQINIEIDGKKVHAEQGDTIIEAADAHNIYIPRFCYHKKLSVAANCRMCLVEVEGSRKAMPACATPITQGMKVKTRTDLARTAQKAVMEFLLINHPLDCPICDQGGQCELQDLAIGYGHDTSRYIDRKRVVKDKSLGPLISTDMTRCILCTRCIRFGEELAGLPELGTMGRGEHTEISTFIERAVTSEVSGNVIDVCPVGALTSKPFRYTARAWELMQAPSIAAHDCLGANINIHSIHQQVKRVVPNENEAINEVWLADRDRFSYVGVNSEQRLHKPMLKKDGVWQEIDWTTALEIVASSFENVKQAYGAEHLAALISPNSTVEEQYLLQKVFREFGSHNIDHRLRQIDFSDQQSLPTVPALNIPIADLEKVDTCLLVGSDIQREQPLAAMRLLKASNNNAAIMVLNPYQFDFHFSTRNELIVSPAKMVEQLAAIAKVLVKGQTIPETVTKLLENIEINEQAQTIAEQLTQGKCKAIILGALAQNSEYAAQLRYFANLIGELSGATVGELTYGANAAGAWLTGCVPHRTLGHVALNTPGLNAQQMFKEPRKAYLLFNLEPEFDLANPLETLKVLKAADFVVACSPFISETMQEYADVILPIVPFSETSGTFINCNSTWQSFNAAVSPLAEARPGWKVLRVLGNFLDLPDFSYTSSQQIRDEVQQVSTNIKISDEIKQSLPVTINTEEKLTRVSQWPLYRGDNVVRRSEPLQETRSTVQFAVQINSHTAARLGLQTGDQVLVKQGQASLSLPLNLNEKVANNCVLIDAGVVGSEKLGVSFGEINIEKKG